MNADAPSFAEQAARLLRLWDDLARQHVSMGGGCACGIGGVTVRLEDFEHDIADYLFAEAERLGRQDVLDLLARFIRPDVASPDEISNVLKALADAGDPVSGEVAGWLLTRLDRTLTSFARLHGGGARGAAPEVAL